MGLLVVGVLSISCGGSSSTPAAPTTTTTTATSPTASTTFSGTVTNPGHGADLSLVPGPSIMGDDALGVTAKDRLHTKILYKRPIGSVTPDTDPARATIN